MKYMGSKSRITKYIVPIIQFFIDYSESNTYIEGFVGGANVIDKIQCENCIGFDNNRFLIALLRHVQNNGNLLPGVSKELYDDVRDYYNSKNYTNKKYEDWVVGNVGFLASYNGRFFDGGYAKSGFEKTKNGQRYRDYYAESSKNLINQSKNLANKTFDVKDFRDWEDLSSYENVVFYFDPPYLNTKKYDSSTNFDYEQFYNFCRKLSKRNIVLVSEQHMPSDFSILWEKSVSRSIKATDKSFSTEKLYYLGSKDYLDAFRKQNI